MARWFSHFAGRTVSLAGHWATFIVSLLLVILWANSGPFFAFSNTWQLVINTATTISNGVPGGGIGASIRGAMVGHPRGTPVGIQ
jgi:hypothetical protein